MADERTERDIILDGAKAAGPCDIEVRGDILLRVLGSGGSKELRDAATKAGKAAVKVKAADLVAAMESATPVTPVKPPTPPTK